MPKPIQRLTDPNTGGGIVIVTDGNTSVYANNLRVSVNTSTVSYGLGRTATDDGSETVFAHNVPVNYTDNFDLDGRVRIGGSGDVYVGDDIDQDIPSSAAVVSGDDDEALTPPASKGGPAPNTGPGSTYFNSKASTGVVEPKEVAREETVKPSGQTSGSATVNKAPTTTDPGETEPNEEGKFPDTYPLSSRFTLGRVTKKPGVVFQHDVNQTNVQGIPTKKIVENLKLLAANTLEPIYAKYPNAFITNTFRPDSRTQHGRGQAADIQFRGVSKAEYYNIAIWIRDNVPYDQLLLEYKTTGSGLPWIHISFAVPQRAPSDPTKVMTFLNDKRETKTAANGFGLIQLAENPIA
jgi:hypothetical protein